MRQLCISWLERQVVMTLDGQVMSDKIKFDDREPIDFCRELVRPIQGPLGAAFGEKGGGPTRVQFARRH